jgi:Na+/proline symporter
VLWIVGLSISLLVFGGFTLSALAGLILRHHLSPVGIVILLSNGFISWMVLDYLLLKIRKREKAQVPSSETPPARI